LNPKTTKPLIPIVLTAIAGLTFLVSLFLNYRVPWLQSISPEIASPGELMVLRGDHFGDEQGLGEVTVAGYTITSRYIESWTDDEIRVILPEGIAYGLVRVRTPQGHSEDILLTNRDELPVVAGEWGVKGAPVINEIYPTRGKIGELMTIKGQNFGEKQGEGNIRFPREVFDTSMNPESVEEDKGVLVPLENIELWSSREIQFRIPTGSASGNITMVNARGDSNPVYFEIEEVGQRRLTNPRTYSVTMTAQVKVEEGERGNALYLWFPRPYEDAVLRNLHYYERPLQPVLEGFSGMDVYQLDNLVTGENRPVSLDMVFQVFQNEMSLIPDQIKPFTGKDSSFYRIYTVSDYLVPVDNPEVEQILREVIGVVENPYDQAKRIYDYLTEAIYTVSYSNSNEPIQMLGKGRGNAKEMSLAFTALCRRAGIPTRPVAGYLVDRNNRFHPHYWAEVFFTGVGWFPVDLALGDGVRYPGIPLNPRPAEYYFGNLDNSHIPPDQGDRPGQADVA
jgi:transglutaminase-like putative cysteine protease